MIWLFRSSTSLTSTTSAIHGDKEGEPTVPTVRAYGVGGGAGNTFLSRESGSKFTETLYRGNDLQIQYIL